MQRKQNNTIRIAVDHTCIFWICYRLTHLIEVYMFKNMTWTHKNAQETKERFRKWWPCAMAFRALGWVVIGQVRQFTTFKLETSDFMTEWSKPPHSLVFPLHTAFPHSFLTFIFQFRFSSFLCFQPSALLLMDQKRTKIITLYIRGAFNAKIMMLLWQ